MLRIQKRKLTHDLLESLSDDSPLQLALLYPCLLSQNLPLRSTDVGAKTQPSQDLPSRKIPRFQVARKYPHPTRKHFSLHKQQDCESSQQQSK